ncbi:MAG: hypothetical protein AAGC55_13925, partial [Myxococcota bacterium]
MLCALVVALAACGGDDDDSNSCELSVATDHTYVIDSLQLPLSEDDGPSLDVDGLGTSASTENQFGNILSVLRPLLASA